MVLKSISASANRLRACTPYSSMVRLRAVVSRQCATNSAPRYTPSEVFVLPASMTRSISEFFTLYRSAFDTQNLLKQIAGSDGAVLASELLCYFSGPRCIIGSSEQDVEFFGDASRAKAIAAQRATGSEPRGVRGVVGLIESKWHDQRRHSRAQS